MNGWIVFQLLIDVALFAIIVIYLIRSGQQHKAEIDNLADGQQGNMPAVDIDQIEKLLDELARLVMRAEKVAARIEKGVEAAKSPEESQADRPDDKEKIGSKEKPAQAIPGTAAKTVTINPSDQEQYGKAAKLIKKGLTNEDIGQIVGLPAHEIGLIRRIGS